MKIVNLSIVITLVLSCLVSVDQTRGAVAKPVSQKQGVLQVVYLPLIVRNYPPTPTIFGGEMEGSANQNTMNKAKSANITWIRVPAFSWAAIEPTFVPGNPDYHWENVDGDALIGLALRDLTTIATVKFTPSWAQKLPGWSCGPIAENYFGEFARFMSDLVKRYKDSPYKIKYWELGNEPDVEAKAPLAPDSVYGCWGASTDPRDPNYAPDFGGGYYAKMLKVVYPAIKAADPEAQVLIGGLLQDCDPVTNPSTCKTGNFFDGILKAGGAPYFDIVSYHGYAPYSTSSAADTTHIWDEDYPGWQTRGGIVLGKLDYLRSVMTANYVSPLKPVILTEASLNCPEWNKTECLPPIQDFYEKQADYVAWLYVRNWANGVLGTVWFTINGQGWRYGGLLDGSGNPKPVYLAYQFLTSELENAQYIQPINIYTNIRGYEFTRSSKRIWVLWPVDEISHTITLPGNVIQVFDKYGNLIPVTDGQATINGSFYIEMSP